MARLKTQLELEAERLETLQRLTGNYPIGHYTKRPALVYSRYSTARQVRDSIQNGLEQSKKQLQRADDLGWTHDLLTLLVENQMTKDGRIRSVSGTIPIEDRAGMSIVIERVRTDNAGAILCDDVSRLTRDADLVDAVMLAKTCKEHDTIIVTSDRVYNFRRQGDFDAFIDEARAAAAFLETHIKNKMLSNRTRKAEQGKLANGVAPVGLVRDGDSLKPSPHASRVDWLYARFRAHNASLNGLLREVLDMAKRGEPLFPVADGIDPRAIFLSRVERDGVLLGWTVTSRFGLAHILTNPAYQGHLVFNGRIVKHNAYAPIVDALNWRYAYEHLASVDLDGTPLERPEKTVCYVQKTSKDSGALLAGTRHDGRAVIEGTNESHVYVKANIKSYLLRKIDWKAGYETAINIAELDGIFEENLLRLLADAEQGCYTAETCTPQARELAYSVNQAETPPDDTLDILNKLIAQGEQDLRIYGSVMDASDRGYLYGQLAKWRDRRAKIERAHEEQARIQAEMRQAASDICRARSLWPKWTLEKRRRFIQLVTQSITLEELADGWLRLTVVWNSLLCDKSQQCFIWRLVVRE